GDIVAHDPLLRRHQVVHVARKGGGRRALQHCLDTAQLLVDIPAGDLQDAPVVVVEAGHGRRPLLRLPGTYSVGFQQKWLLVPRDALEIRSHQSRSGQGRFSSRTGPAGSIAGINLWWYYIASLRGNHS